MSFTTAFARSTDPSTSHAAAASVQVRRSQEQVLGLLRVGPATDQALAARAMAHGIRISPSGLRTRRSELAAMGLVVDSGVRLTTDTGRKAIVWAVSSGV